MKPVHLILPAAALLMNGGYFYWQSSRAETLRLEATRIREVIQSAPVAGVTGTESGPDAQNGGDAAADPVTENGEESGQSVDLAALAQAMEDAKKDRMPNMRRMLQLQMALMKMSPEELKGLMAEAQALDAAAETKVELMAMLADRIAENDPAEAIRILTGMEGEMRDALQRNPWRLTNLVDRWATRDVDAAAKWLDEKTSEGFFELKGLDESNHARNSVEAAIVTGFLKRDIAQAKVRLDALTDADRREVLGSSHRVAFDPEARAGWVGLLREYLPEEDRQWGGLVGGLTVEGKLDKVSGFLQEIDASPGEVRGIALAAIHSAMSNLESGRGLPSTEKAAGIRTWLAETVEEEPDRVLGEALANHRGGDAKKTAELITELHDANPSDDLLASYIEVRNRSYQKDGLEELAAKISDPERRSALLEKIQSR